MSVEDYEQSNVQLLTFQSLCSVPPGRNNVQDIVGRVQQLAFGNDVALAGPEDL